jgi:hypothetical protein
MSFWRKRIYPNLGILLPLVLRAARKMQWVGIGLAGWNAGRFFVMNLGSLFGKTISIRLTDEGTFVSTVQYGWLYWRSEVCPAELPDPAPQEFSVDDSSSSAEY